ncbi:hypothetical protein ACFQ1S_11745, partial [Kibdelosporangium lantanae]
MGGSGRGRGEQFEGAIIRDNLMRDLPSETRRVLPVVLPDRSVGEIPAFLHGYSTSHYIVTEFAMSGVAGLLAVRKKRKMDVLLYSAFGL